MQEFDLIVIAIRLDAGGGGGDSITNSALIHTLS